MRRSRLLAAVGALALILPASTTFADEGGANDGTSLIEQAGKYKPTSAPASAADHLAGGKTGNVTVIVELEAKPVAVVEAETKTSTGSKDTVLSETEASKIEDAVEQEQAAVIKFVKANGGSVGYEMHSAINAVRVTVDVSKLPELAKIEHVKSIHEAPVYERENLNGVPEVGAPGVWAGVGGNKYTGKGVKAAVIDTGVDYTHATFGGEGTVDAFNAATATSDAAPYYATTRVKGGIDLAGDAYNGTEATRKPDANPIDCATAGHGTHVAATLGGSGVAADGKTYAGPFDENTHSKEFKVGPGVAPEVDLYAVKVFGCKGGTSLTTEAIDWAVKNKMDVINLSLGSDYGFVNEADSIAATNAVANGVVVVSAAGNAGHEPYLVSSPSVGAGVVSVSAVDATKNFPGAEITAAGKTLTAINANGAKLPAKGTIRVLAKADGSVSTGCDPAEYAGLPADSIVVTVRGDCARVARAIFAQKAGAIGSIMINSSEGLPPFEGTISKNPDDNTLYDVTTPFLGVSLKDADTLLAADGQEITLAGRDIPNPAYRGYANFTSSGARSGDSALRPSLSAPGVSIVSAAVGTGSGANLKSGTSMATPHAAGVAALSRQAHPGWTAEEISASLVSTASTGKLLDYKTSLGGGAVDSRAATNTEVVAFGDSSTTAAGATIRDSVLSFGVADFNGTFEKTSTITLVNKGTQDVTYKASSSLSGASKPGKITLSESSITVPAGKTKDVQVTLTVNASDIPTSFDSSSSPAFHEVSGTVAFDSDGVDLNVPFLLIPRVDNKATAASEPTGATSSRINVTNPGAATGTVLFTWGLTDPKDVDDAKDAGVDIANVGAATIESQGIKYLAFAVNMHKRFSNAALNEYDVVIDNNNDGTPDWSLATTDAGEVLTDDANGVPEMFLVDLHKPSNDPTRITATSLRALAPTDSATVVMIIPADAVGVTGRFTYTAIASGGNDLYNGDDVIDQSATYDITKRPFTDGIEQDAPAGGVLPLDITVDPAAAADQKPLGYMVVVLDNLAGVSEALTGEVRYGDVPSPTPTVAPTPPPTADPAPPSPTPTAVPTVTPSPKQPIKPTPPPVRPGPPNTGK